MRWHVLRTLLHKELLRHLANRGGLVVMVLLAAATLLLPRTGREGLGWLPTAGVRRCYVDYWRESELIRHLQAHAADNLGGTIQFRAAGEVPADAGGTLCYESGAAAIQIRPVPGDPDGPGLLIWFWHPGPDATAVAPYEAWFWRETFNFFRRHQRSTNRAATLPSIETQHSELTGGLDAGAGLATSLVLFALFFNCTYLLATMACEERERGVLLAQALSPAATQEILAAKLLFHGAMGLAFAAVLAGASRPEALARPLFWLGLAVAGVGFAGIGLAIASLVRTQRMASMAVMGYVLGLALLLWTCRQCDVHGLPWLVFEHYCPRLIHAAVTDRAASERWGELAAAAVLAAGWCAGASVLFRRRGWQD
jgi:hypothetical protein